MVLPITKKNNADFFLRAIDAICELGFFVSVLAEGDSQAQKKCFEIVQTYPSRFEILESTVKNKEKILASSDILLFPGTPEKNMIVECIKRGIVPVLPENNNFEDFNPQNETGNAFTFEENNFWQFFTAIIRSYENFKFPYDWKNIQKNLKTKGL